jgi:hypothetical protein
LEKSFEEVMQGVQSASVCGGRLQPGYSSVSEEDIRQDGLYRRSSLLYQQSRHRPRLFRAARAEWTGGEYWFKTHIASNNTVVN